MDRKSRRLTALVAVSIALACPAARAQTTPAAPAFDVAVIKPSPAAGTGPVDWMGIRNDPDGIDARFVTIPLLIQRAYGLRSADQVSGGPQWARDERFDMQARMTGADLADMQKLSPAEAKGRRERMMQSLLADRFKLRVHSESWQAPLFELVIAKGGPRLKDAANDIASFNQATASTMVAKAESTRALADFLSQPTSGLGRPVVDKTGLSGVYDFTVNWVPHWDRFLPGSAGSSAASPEDANPLFEALQQIGLKLQPATGPIDTIIIDHVERPTAN